MSLTFYFIERNPVNKVQIYSASNRIMSSVSFQFFLVEQFSHIGEHFGLGFMRGLTVTGDDGNEFEMFDSRTDVASPEAVGLIRVKLSQDRSFPTECIFAVMGGVSDLGYMCWYCDLVIRPEGNDKVTTTSISVPLFQMSECRMLEYTAKQKFQEHQRQLDDAIQNWL